MGRQCRSCQGRWNYGHDLTTPRYPVGSALFEIGRFRGAGLFSLGGAGPFPEWAGARFSLATTYARMVACRTLSRSMKR